MAIIAGSGGPVTVVVAEEEELDWELVPVRLVASEWRLTELLEVPVARRLSQSDALETFTEKSDPYLGLPVAFEPFTAAGELDPPSKMSARRCQQSSHTRSDLSTYRFEHP